MDGIMNPAAWGSPVGLAIFMAGLGVFFWGFGKFLRNAGKIDKKS